jgi:MFS-type transporter involved in bile tolerance (Atg22 family)
MSSLDTDPMTTEMPSEGVKVHGDPPSQSGSFRAMERSIHNTSLASTRPPLPRWYPYVRRDGQWQPLFHGNGEALGWAFDSVGRSSAFIGSGAFLGTALLLLAKEAAGCSIERDPVTNEIPECNERIYGIRPSSLLTTYTLVTGVLSAAMLPLLGAMLDYTPHRLWLGRVLSASFCVLMIPSIFISSKTWVMVAVFQVFVAFVGWAQTMVTYSYLPELTDTPDRLNQYNQSFTVCSFSSMVLYLIITTGIAKFAGWSDDTVATARIGTSIALGVALVFLSLAWSSLMQKRPAAHTLRENQSLWTAGFIQVYTTIRYTCGHLPALKWFYVSLMFIDAAIQ